MAKMQSSKFEVEKFSGKNNFELWKLKMHELLLQQGVLKAILGKENHPVTIKDDDWYEMDGRARSAIRMCLAGNVLFNIVSEKTTTGLWTKLESQYMTKSLMSKIYLKRQVYSLWMK
jgi:hypothetical protein